MMSSSLYHRLRAGTAGRLAVGLSTLVLLTGCGGGAAPSVPAAVWPDRAHAADAGRTLQGTPTAPRLRALAESAAADTYAPDADELMDWAERTYPHLFPAGPGSDRWERYTYRRYLGTGHLLGVADGVVYVLGPLTGGALQSFGRLRDHTCAVFADTVACGGTKPALALRLDRETVAVGQPVQLTLTASGATQCAVQPTGQALAQGVATLRAASGGRRHLSVACWGPGGESRRALPLVVPMPVLPTSYENKNHIDFEQTQVTLVRGLGIPMDADEQDSNERSVTFGDFFQEGRYAAFVMVNRARNRYGFPNVADTPGKAYFLAQDGNGRWTDRTRELLAEDARSLCISASYAITADFNEDGRPDVYVSCNGVDFDLGIPMGDPRWRETYLARPVLLLSRAGGGYERRELPRLMYGHQAAAGDIDRDGHVDVISTNQVDGVERMPVVLRGRGDGSFEELDGLLPPNLFELTGPHDGLYNVQLIPIDGRLDVFFIGRETVWLRGRHDGGFEFGSARIFPRVDSGLTGRRYDFPLDLVERGGDFWAHVTSANADGTEWALVRYAGTALTPSVTDLWFNATATFGAYAAQFRPSKQGDFVAYTGGCPTAETPLVYHGQCARRLRP